MIKNSDKTCESCGHPMILVIKKGKRPLEYCINPHCKSKTTDAERKEIKSIEKGTVEKKCPKCGKPMALRRSIYGQFWGCTGYPNCKTIEKLQSSENKFEKKEKVEDNGAIEKKDGDVKSIVKESIVKESTVKENIVKKEENSKLKLEKKIEVVAKQSSKSKKLK